MQKKLPWCLIELLVVMKLAKGVAGSKGRGFFVGLMEGLRAGWPLATLIPIAVMYVLPSAAAEVAMESNFKGMDGAGRPFMVGLSIVTLSLMVGGSFRLGAAAAMTLSWNARSPAARRLMPEPLPCDSARLQVLEANLEFELRYASTAREAQARAEEAQALAEERLLQGEAAL